MADTTITLAGNLAADVVEEETERGIPFATFTLAVTPRVRNGSGQWTDGPTSFQRCVVWRDQAVHAARSLHKGDRVLVVGTLRTRSYANGDGEPRYITEVNVDELGPSLRWATASPLKAKAAEEAASDEEAPAPKRRKVTAS